MLQRSSKEYWGTATGKYFSFFFLAHAQISQYTLFIIIKCFHMTSQRPCWSSKTKKWRPWWCTKLILWELDSIIMQILSFVAVIKYGCWSREWKSSVHHLNTRERNLMTSDKKNLNVLIFSDFLTWYWAVLRNRVVTSCLFWNLSVSSLWFWPRCLYKLLLEKSVRSAYVSKVQ